MRSVGLAFNAPLTAPASVTSSPSSIQVMPSATTTSVWKRHHRKRSSRDGTSLKRGSSCASSPVCVAAISTSPLPSDQQVLCRVTAERCPPTAAGVHESLKSEEHTSELQSLMRNSYAVFCL